jgi:hypothetical protein
MKTQYAALFEFPRKEKSAQLTTELQLTLAHSLASSQ